MKKIFILISICLFLVGCGAQYNLDFTTSNALTETLIISSKKDEFKTYAIDNMKITNKNNVEVVNCKNISLNKCKELIYESDPITIFNDEIDKILNKLGYSYEKGIIDFNNRTNRVNISDKNYYKTKFTNNYLPLNSNNLMLKKIANNYTLKNTNNVTTIKIDNIKNNILNDVNNIDITITFPYEIIETNSTNIIHSKNSITCKWDFNNLNNTNILLKFDTSKTLYEKNKENNTLSGKVVLIIFSLIIVAIGTGFIILNKIRKNKDKL